MMSVNEDALNASVDVKLKCVVCCTTIAEDFRQSEDVIHCNAPFIFQEFCQKILLLQCLQLDEGLSLCETCTLQMAKAVKSKNNTDKAETQVISLQMAVVKEVKKLQRNIKDLEEQLKPMEASVLRSDTTKSNILLGKGKDVFVLRKKILNATANLKGIPSQITSVSLAHHANKDSNSSYPDVVCKMEVDPTAELQSDNNDQENDWIDDHDYSMDVENEDVYYPSADKSYLKKPKLPKRTLSSSSNDLWGKCPERSSATMSTAAEDERNNKATTRIKRKSSMKSLSQMKKLMSEDVSANEDSNGSDFNSDNSNQLLNDDNDYNEDRRSSRTKKGQKKLKKVKVASVSGNSKYVQNLEILDKVNFSQMSSFKKFVTRTLLSQKISVPINLENDPHYPENSPEYYIKKHEEDKKLNLFEYDPEKEIIHVSGIKIILNEDNKSVDCSQCSYKMSVNWPTRADQNANDANNFRRQIKRHIDRHHFVYSCPLCEGDEATNLCTELYISHLKTVHMNLPISAKALRLTKTKVANITKSSVGGIKEKEKGKLQSRNEAGNQLLVQSILEKLDFTEMSDFMRYVTRTLLSQRIPFPDEIEDARYVIPDSPEYFIRKHEEDKKLLYYDYNPPLNGIGGTVQLNGLDIKINEEDYTVGCSLCSYKVKIKWPVDNEEPNSYEEGTVRKHMKSHFFRSHFTYACPLCPVVTCQSDDQNPRPLTKMHTYKFLQHMRDHMTCFTYTCKICCNTYESAEPLMAHLEHHRTNNEEEYVEKYGQIFENKNKMMPVSQEDSLEFHCLSCPKICYQKHHLAVHAKTHLNKKGEEDHTFCESCGIMVVTTFIEEHQEKYCMPTVPTGDESSLTNISSTKESQMQQQPPDSSTGTVSSFGKPKKNYFCVTCGKCYVSAKILRGHERTHQSKSNREHCFCDKCGKDILSSYFKEHQQRYCHPDSKVKDTSCKDCGMLFKTVKSRNRHYKRIHSANALDRLFVCKICNKRFKISTDLARHSQIHSQDKSWVCEFCGTGYSVHRYLKRHMLKCEMAFNRDMIT